MVSNPAFSKLNFSALKTLDDLTEFLENYNGQLGNQLNVLVVEGYFPDQIHLISEAVKEKLRALGQMDGFEVYLETSPYFSVTNPNFRTGSQQLPLFEHGIFF